MLDPLECDVLSEAQDERETRLYKTTQREIYDAAALRRSQYSNHLYVGCSWMPDTVSGCEVVLHTSTHLLESTTSNIAILKLSSSGQAEWLTPRLDREETPFLDGVMRRYLLDEGVIREAILTVNDWECAKREGWRVIGFNGLR